MTRRLRKTLKRLRDRKRRGRKIDFGARHFVMWDEIKPEEVRKA